MFNVEMHPKSIQDRSFEFACRIVKLTEYLHRKSFAARVISRQLIDSGTSVAANLEEAGAAQSKADFISKCGIASKEARESRYWLRLLIACHLVDERKLAPLVIEAGELVAIITTIVKNAGKSKNRVGLHSTFNIQHSTLNIPRV